MIGSPPPHHHPPPLSSPLRTSNPGSLGIHQHPVLKEIHQGHPGHEPPDVGPEGDSSPPPEISRLE